MEQGLTIIDRELLRQSDSVIEQRSRVLDTADNLPEPCGGSNTSSILRTQSENVLRVPDSDVYGLIREVAAAENSRRDNDSCPKD